MKNLWWLMPNGVTDDEVKNIVTIGNNNKLEDGTIGYGGKKGELDKTVRSAKRYFLDGKEHREVFELIWGLVSPINKSQFNFDIKSVEDIQYTVYDADDKGHYDWHIDTFWCNPDDKPYYTRKITIVIQLSDSEDYEGGDFEINNAEWEQFTEGARQKGAVIILPAFIEHRVTPVTKGVRKSLVAWIDGENFR